jgi:uncharacterized protein
VAEGRRVKYVLIGFVRLWRRIISPLYGDVCKYHPTCSAYGLRALEVHGAIRGSWLTIRRIGRCHPWSMGGVDYVPGTPEAEQWLAQVAATASPMGPVGSAASGVKE